MIGQDKLQFHHSFWRSNLVSCERVAIGPLKSQFYLSFWRSNLVSCERVARDDLEIASFWRSNLVSCERVAIGPLDIAILRQFLAIELHFVRSCAGRLEIAILPQFLAVEPHFLRKGCVSCRLVGTAPAPAFKREIEKKERARGQEEKM